MAKRGRDRFLRSWVVIPMATLSIASWVIAVSINTWLQVGFWQALIGIESVSLMGLGQIVDWKGTADPLICDHHYFRFFVRWKKWNFSFLGMCSF